MKVVSAESVIRTANRYRRVADDRRVSFGEGERGVLRLVASELEELCEHAVEAHQRQGEREPSWL